MSLPPRASACKEWTTEDDSRTEIGKGSVLFNYYDGYWGVVVDDREKGSEYDSGWFSFAQLNDSGTFRSGGTSLNGVRVSIYDDNRKRGSVPPPGLQGGVRYVILLVHEEFLGTFVCGNCGEPIHLNSLKTWVHPTYNPKCGSGDNTLAFPARHVKVD